MFSNVDAPQSPQRVRISWEMFLPPDDSGDAPDDRDDGFWPSLDPEECGYIGDAEPSDVDGSGQQARYEEAVGAATERMTAWQRGDWQFIGVVARARVFIPIGGGSFRVMTLDSGGLYGIESDAGDYLRQVFNEERENLLAELRTLARALGSAPDFDEELPE